MENPPVPKPVVAGACVAILVGGIYLSGIFPHKESRQEVLSTNATNAIEKMQYDLEQGNVLSVKGTTDLEHMMYGASIVYNGVSLSSNPKSRVKIDISENTSNGYQLYIVVDGGNRISDSIPGKYLYSRVALPHPWYTPLPEVKADLTMYFQHSGDADKALGSALNNATLQSDSSFSVSTTSYSLRVTLPTTIGTN